MVSPWSPDFRNELLRWLTSAFQTNAPTITGNPVFTGIPSLAGGAISFPATQVPSAGANDLDDYEEGTWTGTISATSGTFTTVSFSEGIYTKIGRMVFLNGAVTITTAGTAAGDLIISGAPFASGATVQGSGREDSATGFICWTFIASGSTTIRVRKYDNTTIIGSGNLVRFSIAYRV